MCEVRDKFNWIMEHEAWMEHNEKEWKKTCTGVWAQQHRKLCLVEQFFALLISNTFSGTFPSLFQKQMAKKEREKNEDEIN